MAMELNKFALAGIGAAARIGGEVEKLVKKISNKEEEAEKEETVEAKQEEPKSLQERFEDLVELGEEKYDELLERGKHEREELEEKVRERVNKLFGGLGLVTRGELEEIEGKIAKLQRTARKASAAKN